MLCPLLRRSNTNPIYFSVRPFRGISYFSSGTDSVTDQNVALLTKVDPVVDIARITDRATVDSATSNCGATGTSTSGLSKNLYTK
jgi:hypothetical protein